MLTLFALACTAPTTEIELTPMEELTALDQEQMHPSRVLVVEPGPVAPGLRGQDLFELRRTGEVAVYELPTDEDPIAAVAALRDDGYAAEPDLLRSTQSVGDPYRPLQWNLDLIGADDAWDESTGAGVVVAVLDTGVSAGGEDTPNLVSGWDFVQDDGWANDANGHGTHVAGTIAQATHNGKGVAGVAPDATILAVRVLDSEGRGWTSDIIAGIALAVEEGADIINMSLGGSTRNWSERKAVQQAESAGCLLIAAGGNDGQATMLFPARFPEVMAVTAVDSRGKRAPYSNWHWTAEITAPGGNIAADWNLDGQPDGILQETRLDQGYGYYYFQGTSMAAPHVSGVAALVMSMGIGPKTTRTILRVTAQDLGPAGKDTMYGYGLVDARAAVLRAHNPPG